MSNRTSLVKIVKSGFPLIVLYVDGDEIRLAGNTNTPEAALAILEEAHRIFVRGEAEANSGTEADGA